VETLSFGGRFIKSDIRVERDAVVFKGLFGREQRSKLEEIRGFAAMQRVVNPGIGCEIVWEVCAIQKDGTLLRVWEYDRRDAARYLASELNKALRFIRSPMAPYRD